MEVWTLLDDRHRRTGATGCRQPVNPRLIRMTISSNGLRSGTRDFLRETGTRGAGSRVLRSGHRGRGRAAELPGQRGKVGAAGRHEQVAGKVGEAADGQVDEQ